MRFLDTNIFLRHLTGDDPEQSPACFALIQELESRHLKAWTSDLVIAEIVFVLTSRRIYGLSREQVRDLLLPIIGLPGLKLPNKRLYHRVFEFFTSMSIDYIDAYHAAIIESQSEPELYSFDRHFDLVPGVWRVEP